MAGSLSADLQGIVHPEYALTREGGAGFAKTFETHCFVHFPEFLTASGLERFLGELACMREHGVPHDLDTFGVWRSPRRFLAIGVETIRRVGTLIPALFAHQGIHDFLSGVTRSDVVPYRDPHEQMAVMILRKEGDEYGAHRDEFPYAFNVCLKAPPEGAGGNLTYAPRRSTRRALSESGREAPLRPGDAYCMHAGNSIHAVSALTREGCERIMLSYAFANAATAGAPSQSGLALFGG